MTSNTTTRRTVLRGAAWTAPAVVVAGSAPALAASPCEPTPVTVDWESARYTRQSATSGYYTIPLSDDTTITMQISSSFTGGMEPGGVAGDGGTANDNLRLSSFIIGGTGERGLVLHQNDRRYPRYAGYNGVQTVTFTFDRQVSTLDFDVTDIDAQRGDFRDAVSVSSNLVGTPAEGVTRETYNGGAWYRSTSYSLVNNALGTNNLRVHGENVTTFQVKYANWDRAYTGVDRDQRVFLTDFRLTVPPVGC